MILLYLLYKYISDIENDIEPRQHIMLAKPSPPIISEALPSLIIDITIDKKNINIESIYNKTESLTPSDHFSIL